MYLAELHGKFTPVEERKEDILTSNVFSFFKYAKREIFLHSLLQYLGLQIDTAELNEVEFVFWPTYQDGTQPDLVLMAGNYYLLFEAKYFSGFGKNADPSADQLTREIREGKLEAGNLEKEFRFVAITAHYTRHQFYLDNPDLAGDEITWLNWHRVALLIEKILAGPMPIDPETRSFAEDLNRLLARKKLRNYAGIEIFSGLPQISPQPSILFFDSSTALFRGDFLGFLETFKDFPKLAAPGQSIFLNNRKTFFYFADQPVLKEVSDHIFMEERQ